MITVTNGEPRVMVTDKHGMAINDAGNRKQLSQEPKVIEEVFLADFNEKYGTAETVPRGVYALLDHIVKSTPTGIREFELTKYKDYLARRSAARNQRSFPDKEDLAAASSIAASAFNFSSTIFSC